MGRPPPPRASLVCRLDASRFLSRVAHSELERLEEVLK